MHLPPRAQLTYTGSGSLGAGLSAGETSSALAVTLDTSATGVFGGQASLSFASHNPDMQDLALPGQQVELSDQVNHYANPVLRQLEGAGTFSGSGTSFVFDFGSLTQGTAGVVGTFALTNLVSGPADELGASFDIGVGPFALSGFEDFSGLVAGGVRNLSVSFDPLLVGLFEQTVRIDLFGENASGFHGALGSVDVVFRADVAPVPVPAAIWMLGSGLVGLVFARRRAV